MDFHSYIQGEDGFDHQKILIVSTGGTIEKTYDEEDGSLRNRETVIKERILDESRYPHHHFSIKVIMQKDSLDMTPEDREVIYLAIREFERLNIPIIVVHGTDTVDQTMSYCEKRLEGESLKIPVVFTGAMRPLGFVDSDAKQNVVESVMSSTLLMPGFYLCFHGSIFKPNTFIKNKKRRTFELKD